jgi:uncharacterized protein DUF5906/DNA primase RepB-like protein/primase-like protein
MQEGAVSGQGVTSPAAQSGEKCGPDHEAPTRWAPSHTCADSSVTIIPDRAEAAHFLSLIGRGAARFTFQTVDDSDRKDKHLIRIIHGTFAELFDQLVRLNRAGAGIFFCVNETDLRGRRGENVIAVRAFHVDLDDAPLPAEWAHKPHVVVETSPGHYHVYWLVDGCALEDFSAKQRALIRRYGGDKGVHDLSRVLRLPGFFHQKREPRLVRIIEANDIPPYRANEFPSAPIEHKRGNGDNRPPVELEGSEPDPDADLDEIERMMAELPNEVIEGASCNEDHPFCFDRDDWLAVCMGLHHSFGSSSERGLNIFTTWSARWPAKDPEKLERDAAAAWRSFNKNGVHSYSAATIYRFYYRAREHRWQEAEREMEAANRYEQLHPMIPEETDVVAGGVAGAADAAAAEAAITTITTADVKPATAAAVDAQQPSTPPPPEAASAQPDDTGAAAQTNANAGADSAAHTQASGTAAGDAATAKAKKTKSRSRSERPQVEMPQTLAEVGGSGFDRDQVVNGVNRRHALVLAGHKAAVMKFEDGDKTFRLISVDALKTWYLNRAITIDGDNGKPKRITYAEVWLNDRDRREYEGIEFAPAGARKGYFNLWQGFAVESRPGDCGKFLAHIKDNVAQGNDTHYNWVIGWFAQIAQQPNIKPGTALALRGPPGVGKTKVGEVFGSLLKPHYAIVADPRYVTGQFNAHMAALLLLHADEAFWAGDKRGEGKLKDLVTGLTHFLEFKGVDPIEVRNLIRLLVTSNEGWVVPAAFRERRWCVLDVGTAHIQDHAYFAAIDHEMDHGGREGLLHHVNLREIPQTAALLEQKIESASPEEKFWLDMLKNGKLPGALEGEPSACRKERFYDAYIQHARWTGVSHRSIETKVGTFLTKHVPGLITDQKVSFTYYTPLREKVTKQAPAYKFPALALCRKAFAGKISQKIDWGSDVADWQADELVSFEPPPEGSAF